jgi:Cu/Ag efflux pump CusA
LASVWLGNLSIAVAVGMIALAGLDETGVVMLLYLDRLMSNKKEAHERYGRPEGGDHARRSKKDQT